MIAYDCVCWPHNRIVWLHCMHAELATRIKLIASVVSGFGVIHLLIDFIYLSTQGLIEMILLHNSTISRCALWAFSL